jgi:DNA-binding transcriptional regulator YiaG
VDAPSAKVARKARQVTGLTQREFAKLIGANHITVSKWENGARKPSRVALRLLDLVAGGPTECMDTLRRSVAREKRLRRLSSRQKR